MLHSTVSVSILIQTEFTLAGSESMISGGINHVVAPDRGEAFFEPDRMKDEDIKPDLQVKASGFTFLHWSLLYNLMYI